MQAEKLNISSKWKNVKVPDDKIAMQNICMTQPENLKEI